MKYYSKNPQELQEYLEKRDDKAKKTARAGRRLLVGNLVLLGFFAILILLIFIVYGVTQKKSAHEFSLNGWDIALACHKKKCQANFERVRVTSAPPTRIVWQQKQEPKIISSKEENAPQVIENSWSSNFLLKNPLTNKDKVFVQIFYAEDEFSFRVFP